MTVQVPGSLPPLWETWIESPLLDLIILVVNQHVGDIYLCLFLNLK